MGQRPDEIDLTPISNSEGLEPGFGTAGLAPGAATGSMSGNDIDDAIPEAENNDDVEATRQKIEETRSNMSQTIDAIQDKLSPSHLAHQAKESVRDATVGKATQMVSGAGDSAKGFGSTIVETIRSNPVPAGLAAIGLGWLFMSRSSGGSNQDYSRYDYYNYSRGPDSRGRDSGFQYDSDRQEDGGSSLRQGVGNVASQAQDKAGQTVSQVQDSAGQMVDQVQDAASQLGQQAQYQTQRAASSFQGMLQEKPLAVIAGATAIGLAVGMAVPSTPQENQLMGEARDNLVQQAQETAQDTVQKVQNVAQETVSTAKDQAKSQFSES